MKKLFLISLFVFVLSCTAFAAGFDDVKGTKFEDSVDLLTEFGIINGYNDGTYRPNNTVTRAEMAKLIIVSLGKESASETLKKDTKFSDVKAGSWAAGYINYAESQGIIKGYPDGTFKPNNTVSYAEASTMLLRALNYTKSLEDKKYPTGYMQVANDAGVLKNVVASSASEGASRGNIAIMVFNTLKANVQKIVSTTTDGKVNYGDGNPLIETTFADYKYIKSGQVVDIDFDDEEISVKDDLNNRKLSIPMNDPETLKELYMRYVELIYNTKTKQLLFFEYADNYSCVVVDIKEIDKKYIYDDKDNEYKYEDALFYNIYNYEEAETAYIVFDGSEIVSVVLEGTPKIYVGLIEDPSITIKNEKGMYLILPDGTDVEYVLSSQSTTKAKKNEVVLFSLDSKERLIIIDRIDSSDALNIQALTSTSITLKGKKETSLAKDVEYYVYIVDKSNDIREAKLSNIDEEFDKCYISEISDVYYLIDFEDTVDADDIVSKLSVSEAKENLEAAVKRANKLLKKESSYSVATYEALSNAVDEANAALKTSTSAAKLELLEKRIDQAIDDLESATSTDKQLRKDYSALLSMISEAESRKASDYTAASYSNLTTALKAAKAIKLENTTSDKINTAKNNLEKAINLLVTNAANNELQSAITTLKNLITKAEGLISKKADYTDSTANALNTALTNAKKLDQSKATVAEVKVQSQNLETAINNLVPKLLDNYKKVRSELNSKYTDINAITSTGYTEDSFAKFKSARNSVNTDYADLATSAEVAKMTNDKVQTELTKVTNLITKIDNVKKLLVTSSYGLARAKLLEYINKGKAIKKENWTNTVMTYEAFQTLLTNAEKVYNDTTKTEAEVKAMISDLVICLG